MNLYRGSMAVATLMLLCTLVACANARIVHFREDFESLTLQDTVDEGACFAPKPARCCHPFHRVAALLIAAATAVWTPTPPAGWTVNRTLVPTGGVKEFEGWTFAKATWWGSVDTSNNNNALRQVFSRRGNVSGCC